ncbi:MAG: amidohydrolase family protein [Planctomycetes bacterium]|nr:amidohydrolase family protein [Planctomycetota bacterium]
MILRAKYVLDAKFELIDGGLVRVEGPTIAEVGASVDLGDSKPTDLGDVLLMPGFVNAHTHLELGSLHSRVPVTPDFCDWLSRLVPKMRELSRDPSGIVDAVQRGLADSIRCGTTLLGDISRFASMTRQTISKTQHRPGVVSFGEVLGVAAGAGEPLLRQAVDCEFASSDLACGISPHATYTVGPETLSKCVTAGASNGMRLCIHAAESKAEEEFLLHETGPLKEFLESVGGWTASTGPMNRRPIEYLHDAGALGPQTLLAHCNYVSDSEIDLLAKTNTSVVYCPRTHHAFAHPPHRFDDMVDAGINVCLGTDSLASNPSLSILDEVRFLASHRPDLSRERILNAATLGGARALGYQGVTGAIAPGMRADLVAVPLEPDGPTDAVENILTGTRQPTFCMVAGQKMNLQAEV